MNSNTTLTDGRRVLLRHGSDGDLAAMKELHQKVYTSVIPGMTLMDWFGGGHVVVAIHEGRLIGFRYQRRVGPEVLGEGELNVLKECRGFGLGKAIVQYFEATLPSPWKISLVINSDAYGSIDGAKRSTEGFWLANGYSLAAGTENTRVFVKTF